MITEDYLSDVEEGIFYPNSFFLFFKSSKTSSVTLSACQSFVLSSSVPVVSTCICLYVSESRSLLWELLNSSDFFFVFAQTLVLHFTVLEYFQLLSPLNSLVLWCEAVSSFMHRNAGNMLFSSYWLPCQLSAYSIVECVTDFFSRRGVVHTHTLDPLSSEACFWRLLCSFTHSGQSKHAVSCCSVWGCVYFVCVSVAQSDWTWTPHWLYWWRLLKTRNGYTGIYQSAVSFIFSFCPQVFSSKK